MSDQDHGGEREKQVRDIAARLGVADFVYYSLPVSKGSGQREAAGDGLLLVGQRGAILQVKAREPGKGVHDSAERARAWITKYAAKARAQGDGTRRELARRHEMGSPLVVFPVRAADLPEEVRQKYACTIRQDTQNWPVIVILDHPQMPEVNLGYTPGVVWFGFSDWWELQRRLRSTSAAIDYVHRILNDGLHVPLWQEAARYAALRAADEASVVGSNTAVPYLAHPDQFDEVGVDLFHDILDKVWPDDGVMPWRTADEYRSIVEFLDAVPPEVQGIVGRWVLRKRSEVARGRRRSSGIVRLDFRNRLVFACSHIRHWSDAQEWMREVSTLTLLRHLEALKAGGVDDTSTLGVGALVEEHEELSGVSYTFVLLNGRKGVIEIPADLCRAFEWRYGVYDHDNGTVSESKIEDGEDCPCLSGRRFDECCGAHVHGG